MTQSLVTISNCQAFQLVGENAISLASGDLTLAAPVPLPNSAEASSGASSANDSTAPILTISVGSASFPLFSSTLFGTHDGKPWLYTFLAELAPSAHAAAAASLSGEDPGPGAQGSPSGTFVRVKLPADVETESSETRKRRDAFEDVLIRHGLLKDGVRAAGDEFGRGVSEAAEENQQAMKQSAQS